MPATSVGGELRGLASRADVVFVGQVQTIEAKGGVVEVMFAVQQPVLGEVGSTYVMKEWAGRWTGGRQRYWVGERAMFFLHAAKTASDGSAGLSSPVDGMNGVVPVVPMGANGKTLLDVRWLQARVQRRLGTSIANADKGGVELTDAVAVTKRWRTDTVTEPKGLRLPEGIASVSEAPKASQNMGETSDARR
jgi:hypothetical protein